MTIETYVKQSNNWKRINKYYLKNNNNWSQIKKKYIKEDGIWKLVYEYLPEWEFITTPTINDTGRGVDYSVDNNHIAIVHEDASLGYLSILDRNNNYNIIPNVPILEGQGRNVKYSPDGKYLAVAHEGGKRLTVLSIGFGTITVNIDPENIGAQWSILEDVEETNSVYNIISTTPSIGLVNPQDLEFTSDSSKLVIVYTNSPYISILNTSDWSFDTNVPIINTPIYGIAFSPDDSIMAIGCQDSPYLRLYNTSDWSLISHSISFSGSCYRMSFSPDGEYLVVGYHLGNAFGVVDMNTLQLVSNTPIFEYTGFNARYSYNGQYIGVGLLGMNFRLVRSGDWKVIPVPDIGSTARSVAFSRDSKEIALVRYNSPGIRIMKLKE